MPPWDGGVADRTAQFRFFACPEPVKRRCVSSSPPTFLAWRIPFVPTGSWRAHEENGWGRFSLTRRRSAMIDRHEIWSMGGCTDIIRHAESDRQKIDGASVLLEIGARCRSKNSTTPSRFIFPTPSMTVLRQRSFLKRPILTNQRRLQVKVWARERRR